MNEEDYINSVADKTKALVECLVEFPEQVVITSKLDNLGWLLVVDAAKTDLGRIIGAKGRTVEAFREIMRAVSKRQGFRISVKVLTPIVEMH